MIQIPAFLNMKKEDLDTVEKRGTYALSVIGCEREGIAYGTAFAEAGFKVTLVDTDQSIIKHLTKGRTGSSDREMETKLKSLWRTGRLTATSDLKSVVSNSDVVIIAVNQKIDENKNVNYSEVEKTAKQVGANLRPGTVVIYAGTASLGFTESIVKEALVNASGLKAGEDFGLAYSPMQTQNQRFVSAVFSNLEPRVAADDALSLESASALLATIAKKGIKRTMSFRAAELATLFSALTMDTSTALSNELAVLCENAGIDYMEIMKLLDAQQTLANLVPTIVQNTKKEVDILIDSAENLGMKLRLATLARQLNEDMIRHAVNLTQNALRNCGRTLRRSRITILGVTGPGTAGERLIKMLETKGAKIIVSEPNASVSSVPNIAEKRKRSVANAVEGSDCIVLLQGLETQRNISLKSLRTVMRSPSAIVDLSRTLEPETAETEGFIYRGLGRGMGKK